MGIRNFPVISIGSANAVHKAATSGAVALPRLASNEKAKFLYIAAVGGTATNVVVVALLESAGGIALDEGFPLNVNGSNDIILYALGFNFVAYNNIGAGDSHIYFYPLEDF